MKKLKSKSRLNPKSVSQLAIARARAINEEHRENVSKHKKIKKSKMSYEDMVAEFLSNNSVTVIDDVEDDYSTTDRCMNLD